MRCNGCANFFRDLFFITIPAVSLHFPFRWTAARISISRHSNSTLFFSSRLLPIFCFSLSFFHKKINRGRFVSTNLAQASSFRFSRHLVFFFFLFFFSYPLSSREPTTTIVNFKPWWIYIYICTYEINRVRFRPMSMYALECIESRERI